MQQVHLATALERKQNADTASVATADMSAVEAEDMPSTPIDEIGRKHLEQAAQFVDNLLSRGHGEAQQWKGDQGQDPTHVCRRRPARVS